MKVLVVLLAAAAAALAQQKTPVTSIQPDCMIFFTLSTASAGAQAPVNGVGTSGVISNLTTSDRPACYGLTLQYSVWGFSGLSLSLQSAPLNSSGTGPGTWADVTVGVTELGINPNTSTVGAITTATTTAAFFRANLTSRTGTGAVIGVLYGYKKNTVAGGGGSGGACPGGSSGQFQYNNAGLCGGSAGFTWSGTRPLLPDGTGASPSFGFQSSASTGIFLESAFIMATRDSALRWAASGVTTNVYQDNDSWRCGEGDALGQRGACEIWSFRVSNNARFWDFTDTFITWGDPAGGGAGTRVGVGRFSSDGASADDVYAAGGDGGALVKFDAKMLKTPGCTFTNLASCFGATSGGHAYCTDCTVVSSIDNTAAAGGSGCDLAIVNGVYKCVSL